jgi:excisionase family DNA binding protein
VPDKLLTIRELAARWSVSPTTIRRLIWRRQLQAERVGGQVRVRESVAEAYLVAHMEPALPPLAAGGRAS